MRDWLKKIMRNGWPATAGEDFITIASNPVRDRPTQQRRNRSVSHSAIERKICVLVTLTVDLYRALRAHYCVQEHRGPP